MGRKERARKRAAMRYVDGELELVVGGRCSQLDVGLTGGVITAIVGRVADVCWPDGHEGSYVLEALHPSR